ncbi:MAG: iron ABC transporter permease [Bacteroidetes bacterium]|nr:MAG: iron ABC transporter permease [Bacteroidota bacterium]
MLAWTARISHEQKAHLSVRLATLGYAVPGAVIAVGMMAIFSGWGQFLTAWFVPLLLACLVRFLAVAYQPIEAGMQRTARSIDDSARSLGASNFSILFSIHFPLIRNSIFAAFIMAFVDIMKELPLTLILRPFNFDTLATRTFDLAGDERMAQAALPALLIVCISIVPALWLNRVANSAHP